MDINVKIQDSKGHTHFIPMEAITVYMPLKNNKTLIIIDAYGSITVDMSCTELLLQLY